MIPYVGPLPPELLWRWTLQAAGDGRPVLLLDGPSGSGKTTLARKVAALSEARLVSLDEFYPGWDGLASASATVARDVLDPDNPGYRRWDWAAGAPAQWVALDPAEPLIVEGSGALTRESRARSSFALWLDADPELRRARALARDGAAYAPHWDRWAAQEQRHRARHDPDELADVVARVEPPPPQHRLRRAVPPSMR